MRDINMLPVPANYRWIGGKVADLPLLRHQRGQLQILADQHGTMTGDTTEQDYEALSDEIADLDDKIADLEGKPC